MVFGEIELPSSRALLYEEDDPENNRPKFDLKWKEELAIPEKIYRFIAVDTIFLIDLVKRCLLKDKKPYLESSNCDVKLYKLEDDCLLCTCRSEEISSIMEKLTPFIEKSSVIYTITTAPSISYINSNTSDKSVYFIRSLQTNIKPESLIPIHMLDVPNLVTGLSAALFTYSKFTDKPCQLFAGYIDRTSLDSVNSAPFVGLLRQMKIGKVADCKISDSGDSNNLYM